MIKGIYISFCSFIFLYAAHSQSTPVTDTFRETQEKFLSTLTDSFKIIRWRNARDSSNFLHHVVEQLNYQFKTKLFGKNTPQQDFIFEKQAYHLVVREFTLPSAKDLHLPSRIDAGLKPPYSYHLKQFGNKLVLIEVFGLDKKDTDDDIILMNRFFEIYAGVSLPKGAGS